MNSKNYIYLLAVQALFIACQPVSEKVTVVIEQPTLPILTQKEANPAVKLQLIKADLPACDVQQITFSLEGTTNLQDIHSLALYKADEKGRFSTKEKVAEANIKNEKAVFTQLVHITADTMNLWLSVKLNDKIELTNRLHLTCQEIKTTDGMVELPVMKDKSLRVGVAVRQHKQDNVHTSRIPALATTKKGTLLAIYDARYESSRDLQGHMDIGLNRSFDGGVTWEPFQVVLDQKEWGGLPERFNGVSDACVLVDDRSGAIYVAGLWMHGVLDNNTGKWITGLTDDSKNWQHQWRGHGSQPGVSVKETSQFLITKSVDDGKTWSEPMNITPTTKRKEWWLYAPAPGHGITLKDGTLVFPTQGRDKTGLPFSNITYSKNGGKTWKTSNPAYTDVTENMAVELSDGSIMLNMRDNRNARYRNESVENGRRVCVTKDLGDTWVEHSTSHKVLTEPTCMASIHRHGDKIFFSNPNSRLARKDITIKMSVDDGATWPKEYWVLLDEWGGAGYSCLTTVNDSVIGILYEGSQANMIFQQILVKEFLKQ